ncbi:hypothetical protein EW145_g7878, partial [Phellinidium pouzarii]
VFSWTLLAADGAKGFVCTRSRSDVPNQLVLGTFGHGEEDGDEVRMRVIDKPQLSPHVSKALDRLCETTFSLPHKPHIESVVIEVINETASEEKEESVNPAIMIVHGGPHISSTNAFNPLYAALALEKYTLYMPNYTGSLGYGMKHIKELIGKLGDIDVQDCIDTTKGLIIKGVIKEGFGCSITTYIFPNAPFPADCAASSTTVIGQYPTFFSAVSLGNPLINAGEIVATTDTPDWCYAEFGLKTSGRLDSAGYAHLFRRSPAFHAQDIITPMMLLIGEQDQRVPPSQGINLYHLLKGKGTPVDMLTFPGKGHSLEELESMRTIFEATQWWFGKLLNMLLSIEQSKCKPENDNSRSADDDEKLELEQGAAEQPALGLSGSTDGFDGDDPYFIRDLEYSEKEEAKVIRILDIRLFSWILLTTFVLNMDRTNNSNAITDNMPADLGFNVNVVNTATAINAVLFSVTCLSGSVVAKIFGPVRFIAITEGGVIPATLIYLESYYKSTELATRLAWFWGVQSIASAVSGLMARFYLPGHASRTKTFIRGWKPWFSERQVQIAVTRVIRDDISKRKFDTTVTWADVKDAVTDVGLWLHLIITFVGQTPTIPLSTYLPTVIDSFNFNIFIANALTAPPYVLLCITMVVCVWNSDRTGERGWHGAFGAAWFLIGWILLRALPHSTSRGVKYEISTSFRSSNPEIPFLLTMRYFAACVVESWPMNHPLNIAWISENMGTIGKKTVASGMVIAAANIYGTWGSQIYQASDQPVALVLWAVLKLYYVRLNARNVRLLAAMTEEQRAQEELVVEKKGNRSVLFKFTT